MAAANSPLLRWLLAAVALTGLAISMLLWLMHVPALEAMTERLCAPTPTSNCQDVLASPYARVRGIPLAAIGAAYFAFLTTWFVVVGVPNSAGRRWHGLLLGQICVGAAASASLLYVMAVRLPVWCPWCVASHGVNFLLLGLSIAAIPRRSGGALAAGDSSEATIEAAYPSTPRAVGTIASFAAVVALAGLAGLCSFHQAVSNLYRDKYLSAVNNADYVLWRWRSASRRDIALRADDPATGAADAPNTVVVFGDFQCPHCRAAEELLTNVERRYKGQLRVVFKHYPLCADCNPKVPRGSPGAHRFACEAAWAAEAARRVAGSAAAWDFQKRLYAAAETLSSRPYLRLAAEAGLDAGRFGDFLSSEETKRRIAEDVKLAAALGVASSGVVFLNGRRLDQWQILRQEDPARMDAAATLALWSKLLNSGTDAGGN